MLRDGRAIGALDLAGRRPALHRHAGRAAPDLRRPGGDRHRERAPVHGAGGAQRGPDRGAGAADGHRARSCASSRGSPTDVQPVFDAIARERARLVRRARSACIFRFDGRAARSCAAVHDGGREARRALRGRACAARSATPAGRAVLDADGPCTIADVRRADEFREPERRARGARATRSVAGRSRCCARAIAIGAIVRRPRASRGPSPSRRSPCWRPSPTRR